MNGAHTISRNPLPEAPVISQPADVCQNAGSLVFTITTYSGTPTWTYNGGGTVNGLSVTFDGSSTGTKTVKAQTSLTYPNAPTCYSEEVTQTASVNTLPTISHSGGSATQSVNLGTEIAAMTYTASNSGTIFLTGGDFPDGVTGTPSGTPTGSSYTVSGTPSATGTYGYSLTAVASGCSSSATTGTITVNASGIQTSTGGPITAYSDKTWIIGTQTWSDRIVLKVCTYKSTLTSSSTDLSVQEYTTSGSRVYYNWGCVNARNTSLCPTPWRVPVEADFLDLILELGGSGRSAASAIGDAWGYGGYAMMDGVLDSSIAFWGTNTPASNQWRFLKCTATNVFMGSMMKYTAFQLRCVQ
jgi:hypothetical protein